MDDKKAWGRPRKFTDAEKLYNDGMKYIEECISNDKHLTYTGLCISLGVIRETMLDYESGKYDSNDNRFSDSVKALKLHCEQYAENRLFGNNPTGAIFALKNYGWKDKQEIETTTTKQDITMMSDEDKQKRIDELRAKLAQK